MHEYYRFSCMQGIYELEKSGGYLAGRSFGVYESRDLYQSPDGIIAVSSQIL